MPSEPVLDEAAIKAAATALAPHATYRCNTCAGTGVSLPSGLDCTPCDATGLKSGLPSELNARAAREVVTAYFAALDREALIEPFDGLLEALERVDYEGQIGDVEDVDDTRADAIAALPRLRAALGLIPTEGGDDAR